MICRKRTLSIAPLMACVILILAMAPGQASVLSRSADYQQVNLVSDLPGVARYTDADLVNPWGIVIDRGERIWVADNGTGLATLYGPLGNKRQPVVAIAGAPTGVIPNDTDSFVISANVGGPGIVGVVSAPSRLIFATEDGKVFGYNPDVDPFNAILASDNSEGGSVYKGIAAGSNQNGNFLFLTDFHNGVIDMLDSSFNLVGSFFDPGLLPPEIGSPGFAPFGIRNIGGMLVVTYAMQDEDQHDDVAGAGSGFVDIFDTSGNFVSRFASGGTLNSPWGIERANGRFGKFSDALLIGNFGDGRINAFRLGTGAFLGQLEGIHGVPISISGLWGLTFSRSNRLYFTAGLNHEADGLLGYLIPR